MQKLLEGFPWHNDHVEVSGVPNESLCFVLDFAWVCLSLSRPAC